MRSTMLGALIFLVFGLLTLLGCSESAGDTVVLRHAIVNGVVAESPQYDAVMMLSAKISGVQYPYCSGVLIAPDVVLTAAHCLNDEAGFDFDLVWSLRALQVIEGLDGASPAARIHEVERYQIHPGYLPNTNKYADIALLWLKDASDVDPLPLVQYDGRNSLTGADPLTFVGYGSDELSQSGVRKRVSGYASNTCDVAERGTCEFDLSGRVSVQMPPASFICNIEKGGPCFGDSGGPALVTRNDALTIAGIVSGGDDGCSDYAIVTDVAPYRHWIGEQIEEAAPAQDACSAAPLKKPVRTDGLGWGAVALLGLAFARVRRAQN